MLSNIVTGTAMIRYVLLDRQLKHGLDFKTHYREKYENFCSNRFQLDRAYIILCVLLNLMKLQKTYILVVIPTISYSLFS